MIRKKIGVLAVGLAFLAACSTSPTGRRQLTLLPEGQMAEMGSQAFQQMKQEVPTESDPAWNAYVRCIAQPLTRVAAEQMDVKEWEVVVFRDESANAFALPGGKIGVHTGMFKIAKTDGQLAAVMGHEVGHVIARHGNERVSQAVAAQGGLAAIGAITKDNPQSQILMAALGLGAQFGILLPHSRAQESESDLIGLDLMSRSGFDPRESVKLWENMKAAAGGAPPEWMSTHPANDTRIQQLQANMGEAVRKYQQAQQGGQAPKCRRP